jgi:hypothetical protein
MLCALIHLIEENPDLLLIHADLGDILFPLTGIGDEPV